MRAVIAPEPGGPEALVVTDLPDPEPAAGEVVIDVVASAVNRADTLQRQGKYPVPPGASEVLGLECSGVVSALGEGVDGFAVGDEVCALLAGGGYGEKVAVPAGQVMPLPPGTDVKSAAALPEVACTVWSNVFMVAGLQPDETFLVHGGSGGIGNCAIQLGKAFGARVFATAGSPDTRESSAKTPKLTSSSTAASSRARARRLRNTCGNLGTVDVTCITDPTQRKPRVHPTYVSRPQSSPRGEDWSTRTQRMPV